MQTAEIDVYNRIDLTVLSGEGVYVTDAAGRRYLDLYGGHATALLGHGHPRLLEALQQQAQTLFFQTNLVDVPVRRRAVDALGRLLPAALSSVFFVNSGAEANENALRLAVRRTGRSRIVALEGGFHGRTAAAAAVTWGAAHWYGFPQRPVDVTFLPFDDLDALKAIDTEVAALIVEPVQGVAGARALSAEWLQAARAACDAAGAMLISDEVQCGLGRTGSACAIAAAGVLPDLLTLGKGLAGGFPCAAVLTQAHVAAILAKGDLGTTFGGGPMACALVEAVAEIVRTHDLPAQAQARHAQIRATCQVGPVTSVQGAGLLVGLNTRPPARDVVTSLRQQGILVGTSADPHTVRLMPPLTVGPEHIEQLAQALEAL